MTVRTNNEMMPSYTVISNDFIDSYMASANGEYVKVYLYVLRAGGDASCEEIADALEMTASDAARAVNYWSKRGLLSIHEEEAQENAARYGRSETDAAVSRKEDHPQDRDLNEICTAGAAGAQQSADIADVGSIAEKQQIKASAQMQLQTPEGMPEETCAEPPAEVPEEKSGIDIEKLQQDEKFAGLLYSLQKYLGRTFVQKDLESLGFMYDSLHMSEGMIEYLAEVCVKRGCTKSSFMESIARDWADKGITTVEAAKEETSQYGRQIWLVMREFGLNDRKPAPVELEYIEKWFDTYAMPESMVKDAISRTMEAIHKPSFAYADSILEKWHTAGAHSLDDAQILDREHEKASQAKNAKAQSSDGRAKPRITGFSNFKQRDNKDMESRVLAMLKDKL